MGRILEETDIEMVIKFKVPNKNRIKIALIEFEFNGPNTSQSGHAKDSIVV